MKDKGVMNAKVYVTLKKGVLDPQGKAVGEALASMGYSEVKGLRIGKFIEVELVASSKQDAEKRIKEMCEKLLANTIVEDFTVKME
jgi:phosphoribosylformylglycinamidine synthase subunit PurS